MTKYITLKLTEDQLYALLDALESEIELNEPYGFTADENKQGFLKRLQVKLAQVLVIDQAKSL